MANPTIDPEKLASIRAKQDYQAKLDTHRSEEEKRLKRKANFRRQAILLPVIALPIFLCANYVPTMQSPDLVYGWLSIGIFLILMEIFLLLSFFVAARPIPEPQEA